LTERNQNLALQTGGYELSPTRHWVSDVGQDFVFGVFEHTCIQPKKDWQISSNRSLTLATEYKQEITLLTMFGVSGLTEWRC